MGRTSENSFEDVKREVRKNRCSVGLRGLRGTHLFRERRAGDDSQLLNTDSHWQDFKEESFSCESYPVANIGEIPRGALDIDLSPIRPQSMADGDHMEIRDAPRTCEFRIRECAPIIDGRDSREVPHPEFVFQPTNSITAVKMQRTTAHRPSICQ